MPGLEWSNHGQIDAPSEARRERPARRTAARFGGIHIDTRHLVDGSGTHISRRSDESPRKFVLECQIERLNVPAPELTWRAAFASLP